MSTKERVVLIHWYQNAIVATTLRYPDEVTDASRFAEIKELPAASEEELALFTQQMVVPNLRISPVALQGLSRAYLYDKRKTKKNENRSTAAYYRITNLKRPYGFTTQQSMGRTTKFHPDLVRYEKKKGL